MDASVPGGGLPVTAMPQQRHVRAVNDDWTGMYKCDSKKEAPEPAQSESISYVSILKRR